MKQWDDDPELADIGPQSIYKVVRQLKKDDHGPYNCLASIVADAAFLRDVRRRYPTLPVFANLRCGLWYVDPNDGNDGRVSRQAASGGDSNDEDDAVGTCYFKSTDGHCNNWSFSATRLNVHVAEAAATRGGCVVVDATRSSTKRFPDSFSKTIPVWAETISRAVARRRGIAPPTVDDDESINPESSHRSTWGSGPHLPVWVGDNERNAIASRMPAFEETLHAVLHDTDVLDALATKLAKPLRCVWVSRENEHSLPCVDVDVSDLDFTPVVLVTASEPMQRHGERRTGEGGVPYAYIPGAGDDEESWARGLTPAVFWAHKETVLGPNGSGRCAAIVDRIVKKTRGNEAAGMIRGVTNDEDEGEDSAHLAPRGCLSPNERAVAARGSLPLGAGAVRRLVSNGGVSLALGSVHALALEATWDAVDAVLYVGEDLPPLPADPARWRHPESVDGDGETATGIYPAPFLHAPMRYAKVARRDVADGLEACLGFIRAHSARGGGTTLVACKDGVDHCVGVVVAALIDDDDDESEHSVSKDGVRRRLADVARVHPECRPSRGTLKQVFNRMFEMRR